jgi:predicted esterase
MERLRLLCLHGYHGNAETLRQQLSQLSRALETVADFVCVDAPSLAKGDFGWWHATKDANDGTVRYRGWTRTRDALSEFCAAHGPFDGVFGFSQGAAVAALLVALSVDTAAQPRFELAPMPFAILTGGFVSRDPRHATMLEVTGRIDVPSFHTIGRADSVVSAHASHALASRFRAPTITEHDGGHVVASTPDVRNAALDFLRKMAHHARSVPT